MQTGFIFGNVTILLRTRGLEKKHEKPSRASKTTARIGRFEALQTKDH